MLMAVVCENSVSAYVCVCVFHIMIMLVQDYLLCVFSWVQLISSGWNFPASAFFRGGFVGRYYLNLTLSWNIMGYSSIVIESFAVLMWNINFRCNTFICVVKYLLLIQRCVTFVLLNKVNRDKRLSHQLADRKW